ncbi:unnamed protein product [Periconia digitata]|uniref:Uncharacterized protein n=1 Tax=Periconia digitata TaxID=1303443 RepID=A0A9W4XPX0_9PLEO|nr:unnamed protein product [Periconia digitata]
MMQFSLVRYARWIEEGENLGVNVRTDKPLQANGWRAFWFDERAKRHETKQPLSLSTQ